jgi:hypothetical protein
MIKLTTEREITPYVWVHPEDDRSRVAASRAMHSNGRGRDEDFSSPPAEIPACAANAPGSSLGFWRRSGDKAAGV